MKSTQTLKNQRKRLDRLFVKLGLQRQDAWYSVTREHFALYKEQTLIQNQSVAALLPRVFKEFLWLPWLFERVPKNFWSSKKHHELYFNWLCEDLGIETQEEWYSITSEMIIKRDGKSFLEAYGYSVRRALQSLCPQFSWTLWLFEHNKNSSWKDVESQKKFLDWAAEELGVLTEEEWYCVSSESVSCLPGGHFIDSVYKGVLLNALQTVYPHRNWFYRTHLMQFVETVNCVFTHSVMFQERQQNFRRHFEWIAEQLGVRKMEDWYNVTGELLKGIGAGHSLLSHFGGSHVKALESVYSEFTFLPWQFEKVPQSYWDNLDNQRRYFDWVAKELELEEMSQWYSVSPNVLKEMNGGGILNFYFGSVQKALKSIYPEYNWPSVEDQSEGQFHACSLLKVLLGHQEILSNYKHPQLFTEGRKMMELDIYIPSLELAFEYNGMQHYKKVSGNYFGALSAQQHRDQLKHSECKKAGITLVEVPYWWNCSLSSLLSVIQRHRPEVRLAISSHSRTQGEQ